MSPSPGGEREGRREEGRGGGMEGGRGEGGYASSHQVFVVCSNLLCNHYYKVLSEHSTGDTITFNTRGNNNSSVRVGLAVL